MRRLIVAVLLALSTMLVVAPAGVAAKPGNSPNAKACQKGGWQNWVRADQTAFSSEQECTSYAAQGGVLTAPLPATAETACLADGGTFGTGPDLTGGDLQGRTIIWTCNGRDATRSILPLIDFCLSSPGYDPNAINMLSTAGYINNTCAGYPI